MLSFISIQAFFIVIPAVLFLHEMEEWNIVRFHRENYDVQLGETNMSERLWLFILSEAGLFFSIACFNIPDGAVSCSIFLVLVTFLIINGIQHVLLSIIKRKYNPGLIFGGILGTMLGCAYDAKMIAEKIVPPWVFILITAGMFIPAAMDTVKSRRERRLPTMVALILRFSKFVERKLNE